MNFNLREPARLMPSPGGAYYCVSDSGANEARKLLRLMLQQETAPLIDEALLEIWFPGDVQAGLQTLHHLQNLGWLQLVSDTQRVDQGTLEDLLPRLLEEVSSEGKALLADSQGFCLSSAGFAHESDEEISALGADLVTLHGRHAGLLNHNLKLVSANWGLLDAAGHSQLGFWPLHVGKELFSLAVSGTPCLHRQAFLRLTWILHVRYATDGRQ